MKTETNKLSFKELAKNMEPLKKGEQGQLKGGFSTVAVLSTTAIGRSSNGDRCHCETQEINPID